MFVKILGALDLAAFVVLLMIVFGATPYLQITVFCAGILFVKGLFILGGEPLSAIDLIASVLLVLSIFFTLPAILLWIVSFLLLSKGVVSFI